MPISRLFWWWKWCSRYSSIISSEMRIVASTASMLEEPTRENEEPFWIQSRTFMSHGLLKAPWGSSIYKLRLSEALTLTEAASASLKLPYPHRYSSEATLSAQPRFGLFNYVALLGPISRYFWGTYKVRKMCLRNTMAKFSCLKTSNIHFEHWPLILWVQS